MREKIIAFVRNKKNGKKVNNVLAIILIFVILFSILGKLILKIPTIWFAIIFIIATLCLFIQTAVDALIKVDDNIIYKNPIICVFIANRSFIEGIELIVILFAAHFIPEEISFNFLISTVISVIMIALIIFTSGKISKYFSKKLKM